MIKNLMIIFTKALKLTLLLIVIKSTAFAQGLSNTAIENILDLATQHLKSNHPSYSHYSDNTVRIEEDDENWIVIFEYNDQNHQQGAPTGDAPSILFSKESLELVSES